MESNNVELSLFKFILCVLMTQLGKTFTIIEKMLTEIKLDYILGRSIHVIFTMNTLLNNQQFAKRLDTIESEYGKGSVCIFSSKYHGPYCHIKNIRELLGICAVRSSCPRIIVMCSNKTRFKDGVEFINILDENKSFSISRVFAYYDEIHEYINEPLRRQIEQIHDLDIIHGITGLTATPNRIFQSDGLWNRIQLFDLNKYDDTNYIGHKDMTFNCVDDFFENDYKRPSAFDYNALDDDTIGFIEHVLQKHPEILQDNTKTFIPGHKRRSGHNYIRDLIFDINPNSAVITINGIEKTLQYNDGIGNTKTLLLASSNKGEEVCDTISKLIISHGLQSRPIVVTGMICVGMGQTIVHESLGSFTHAIFSHMDLNNDEIYQLFGRVTGRMKNWKTYTQTEIYCPTIIMNRFNAMEICAKNMACQHNGDIVSHQDYIEPIEKMDHIRDSVFGNFRIQEKNQPKEKTSNKDPGDKDFKIFDTQQEAIDFGKTMNFHFYKRKSRDAPETLKKNGENPTEADILHRMWGINKDNKARMIPMKGEKWCVYWRPSLLT